MERLSQTDLRAALDVVAEAHQFPDLPTFRAGVLPGLHRLVPCDLAGYNEMHLVTQESVVVGDPPDVLWDDVGDDLIRLADQHPLISRAQQGDGSAAMLSDFFTEREYHGSELYEDFYRLVGAEDQIAISIGVGGIVIGLALNRGRRSFTERDRAMLELVRPHYTQALGEVQARELAARLIRTLEAGLEQAGRAVIALDRDRGVAHAGPAARELLDAYFAPRTHGALPLTVREWLRDAHAPLVVRGERGALTIQKIDGTDPALLLTELRVRVDLDDLRALGLTRRQAEVLQLVVAGLRNEEIADELVLSRRTVEKHVEQLCARLGVRTRTEAVAVALGGDVAG